MFKLELSCEWPWMSEWCLKEQPPFDLHAFTECPGNKQLKQTRNFFACSFLSLNNNDLNFSQLPREWGPEQPGHLWGLLDLLPLATT